MFVNLIVTTLATFGLIASIFLVLHVITSPKQGEVIAKFLTEDGECRIVIKEGNRPSVVETSEDRWNSVVVGDHYKTVDGDVTVFYLV
ncbi:TPA: hypothetical protein DIU27_04305 [Candidatus Collierbacteria bacterium]|uniref:Uncharacterized protein n=1 Tax=Candidatus Collierbacteria bacterium GW2011_GWB2_44_22 TaxID=1618387 RepID=A0A0G1KUX7_9BACT|nr:MAG: hypothetical protein UW31_C0013G0013 [Candidatus Collierbacteria bacterium GW2011_GWA2_44_13]KKT51694.1 MAG: hypothetical protein UW44_C0008G0016 [Candidatus Collierbacteria bacterium GW2011_GWB2_44_22]KKT62491.1 MAG: hypothetical protein UW56_C0006G0014 [Candidatus Collierbacteria bacterium GW2011_GWD1_44_27]KKT66913.1 MAG: hypothetical protein UW58_C0001G0017 [Candidatus Collierbacteria bacterium GW2011_GWC2_44_30]KKT88740.1 MAG: hypothetical protein UW88_C0008G0014 [Candidatus Collie